MELTYSLGISIGSVGGRDDNDVANIVISDSTVTNSDNGTRQTVSFRYLRLS